MGVWSNKKVLVAGGTGLIGAYLVDELLTRGARVRVVSLDDPSRARTETEFVQLDLTVPENCAIACEKMDYVFNLLCAKGSPEAVNNFPATLMRPMLLFNTHLLDAAIKAGVAGYLYTSSVGVYFPAEVLREDDVERNPLAPNDRFAGFAKYVGERYAEACQREHNIPITIVRPPNVYGPGDNFDLINAMVIPSIIKKALSASESGAPLTIWGDGSAERDYIHARDAACSMLLALEKGQGQTFNIGTGVGISVRVLVNTILSHIHPRPPVVWDTAKPTGDKRRVLDISRISALGFKPTTTLDKGIKETIDWYIANRDALNNGYSVFRQTKP